MKFLLALSLFIFYTPLKAEVNSGQVESMLEQMVRENVISAYEAEKAKIRLRTMNPQQWAEINKQSKKVAARSPASVNSVNRVEEVQKINLDGAQFKQIQDDIKKIIPEYRNHK